MVWLEFIICVAIVITASNVLSRYADVIAEKTGLGRAWVGAILLAGVTSLPELVSGAHGGDRAQCAQSGDRRDRRQQSV